MTAPSNSLPSLCTAINLTIPDRVPNKLEPGNVNYELAYGCCGVIDYLEGLAAHHGRPEKGRTAVEAAFGIIAAHEATLSEPNCLLDLEKVS